MAHSTRRDPVAAVGLEEIGIADRTQPMLGPYLVAINPAPGQNPGREPWQIELEVARTTGLESLPETV